MKIICELEKCVYNRDGICTKKLLKINAIHMKTSIENQESETYCMHFEQRIDGGNTNAICPVENCKHNKNTICRCENLIIKKFSHSNSEPEDTFCGSFEKE